MLPDEMNKEIRDVNLMLAKKNDRVRVTGSYDSSTAEVKLKLRVGGEVPFERTIPYNPMVDHEAKRVMTEFMSDCITTLYGS